MHPNPSQTPTSPKLLVLIAATALLAGTAPLAAQEERREASAKVPGGRVAVSYTPTDLRGRSLEKDLKPGDVWRMSAGPAAELHTTVPLLAGTTVVAPGKYRLSARFKGGTTFTLMLFRGPFVYTRGTPAREVPLRLHESERGREKLTWAVQLDPEEGNKGDVRFRLQWGRRSLNFNMLVLPMFKAKFRLAGKPATVTCFGLPRNDKMVDLVKGGLQIQFGILEQDGPNPIRYDLWGQNTRQGYFVLCRNFTVPDTRLAIEANKGYVKGVEATLEKGAGDQAEGYTKWLEDLRAEIATLKKVLDVAEELPRKVKVACQIRGNTNPEQKLVVEIYPANQGKAGTAGDADATVAPLEIRLNFGQRTATCVLNPKQFEQGS